MPDTKSDVSERGVHAWGNDYPKIAKLSEVLQADRTESTTLEYYYQRNWSTSYSKGGLQGQDESERDISRAMSDGT